MSPAPHGLSRLVMAFQLPNRCSDWEHCSYRTRKAWWAVHSGAQGFSSLTGLCSQAEQAQERDGTGDAGIGGVATGKGNSVAIRSGANTDAVRLAGMGTLT
jgi:hypothetical protein